MIIILVLVFLGLFFLNETFRQLIVGTGIIVAQLVPAVITFISLILIIKLIQS